MSTKSITFLMPTKGSKGPAGGFKVVYEYANRLAADGYDVHIAYPVTMQFSQQSFLQKLRAFPRLVAWIVSGVSCRKWFKLDKSVTEHLVLGLKQRFVPKTDYYVATGVKTAYYLKEYKNIALKRRLYLIQDYETWGISQEYVINSYTLGLTNITISNWLADKVIKTGSPNNLIKNGFDFNFFKLTSPIERRNPLEISMLYHLNKRKGCKYGIKALEIVKEQYPDLKVTFFGTPNKPTNLPEWIEYFRKPDQETHNRIYNRSAIYLAPSLQEGWGLTVGEAMICGAAIVCTDTLGFREMVEDGVTGIIAPTADAQALADNIIKLIENDDLRIKLAKNGNTLIQSFTWDNSFRQFKSLLND